MAQRIEVQLIGDDSSLSRALRNASSSSDRFGSRFGKVAKGVGIAAAGVAGAVAGGMIVTLKRGFDELAESQKVMAQTEAVIKSTGKAANVSAKDVEDLAGSLSKVSGVDDEVIQGGENMLLTFTNIRNEVGKGNDIFDQATAAALDMSVALGTDMTSAAMQLGKAMNDPVAGMTKLQRSGVTFTAAQKDMVKGMVEAGDTMGAQKIILEELNKEFGGSAKAFGETMPGQLSKLKNSFDEVAGELATKFLPMITGVVEWVNDHWPEIEATINAVGVAIQSTFKAIGVTVEWLKKQWEIHRDTVVATWMKVQTTVQNVVRWINTNVVPPIRNVINTAKAIWKNFGDEIKAIGGRLVETIKITIQNMIAPMKILILLLKGDFSGAWKEARATITRTVGGMVDNVKTLLTTLGSASLKLATMAGKAIVKGLREGAQSLWESFISWISGRPRAIVSALGDVSNLLWSAGWSIMNSLWRGMKYVWEQIQGWVSGLGGWLVGNKGPKSADAVLLKPHGRAIMGGLAAGMQEGWRKDVVPFIQSAGPALSMGMPTPGMSVSAASPGVAPTTMTLGTAAGANININADVRSPADVEILAQAVARKLAFAGR